MELVEKIGLGLYPLEEYYGFRSEKKYGKVYYRDFYEVRGTVRGESIREVNINLCVKGKFFQAELELKDCMGKCVNTHIEKYDWNTSVDEVLFHISSTLKGLGLKVQ